MAVFMLWLVNLGNPEENTNHSKCNLRTTNWQLCLMVGNSLSAWRETCLKATYGVSWITCVVRSSRVRLCSLFPVLNHTFVLLFFPPLPFLVSEFGKYRVVSISTDLVRVMVSGGWLLLAELPWMPAYPAWGLWLKAHTCSLPWNHHPL